MTPLFDSKSISFLNVDNLRNFCKAEMSRERVIWKKRWRFYGGAPVANDSNREMHSCKGQVTS